MKSPQPEASPRAALRAIITSPARSDIETAAEWYENQREGLGLEFTDHVLEAIEVIERRSRMMPS